MAGGGGLGAGGCLRWARDEARFVVAGTMRVDEGWTAYYLFELLFAKKSEPILQLLVRFSIGALLYDLQGEETIPRHSQRIAAYSTAPEARMTAVLSF